MPVEWRQIHHGTRASYSFCSRLQPSQKQRRPSAPEEGQTVKIEDFAVEIWMNAYETRCLCNLAETCVDSITFGDLMALSGKGDEILAELGAMKLTYGAIEGGNHLRRAIASLYTGRRGDDVLVTHGAIGANALLYET